MDLGRLTFAQGAKKKTKRVGRGPGSGHGKTSCRGHKGQHARSGSKHRSWFEGGQMPLQRRIPKRGFASRSKTDYQVLNLSDLGRIEGNQVTPESLFQAKLIRSRVEPVKILGNGELTRPIEVSAHAFSQSAEQKIQAAGGKVVRLC
ncbi:MAG: 50S ribosomal protein L15 [bacterium]|nr:50S ribosomal protein L15 [bacterium]